MTVENSRSSKRATARRWRVLIAPDKFKGTLTSAQAAAAICKGWLSVRPRDRVDLLPITDGGDGFGDAIAALTEASRCRTATIDAAGRPCRVRWFWARESRLAIIESARVIGLAMLPIGRYHPFDLDTCGLGKLILSASRKGVKEVMIGLGGSATNDGGFGMARALGWRFLDSFGRDISDWTEMSRLSRIEEPNRSLGIKKVTAAADVRNPLLGPTGASRIFGPQKGLRSRDMRKAEKALAKLSEVLEATWGGRFAEKKGAGAAGGLGFGILAFLGGRIESGFELFADRAGLYRRMSRADIVVTGEGAIDRSSLMGKGVGEIARFCRSEGIPCFAVAGTLKDGVDSDDSLGRVEVLSALTSVEEAMRRPSIWVRKAGAILAKYVENGLI